MFFPGVTNVAGMNFDEIVFFRHKEVTVYPDDKGKPSLGEGLNKKAQVTTTTTTTGVTKSHPVFLNS